MGNAINITKIREKVLVLDPAHRKMLTEELNFSQRKALISAIRNKNIDVIQNNEIKDCLSKVTHLTPFMTRRSDKSSWTAQLFKKFKRIVGDIAYFFNILTADKTNRLIIRELGKNSVKQGKSITFNELKKIILKQPSSVNLSELLEKNGFPKTIDGITFKDLLNGVNLNDVTFINCTFDWSNFNNVNMNNVTFQSCDLENTNFTNTSMKHCLFNDCEFQEAMFTGALLEDIIFLSSSLIGCSFEDATISNSAFKSVAMPATHFLEASVSNTRILQSSLAETVFFGVDKSFDIDETSQSTAIITKPIAAMIVLPESRGVTTPKAYMKLDQTGGMLPLRIAAQAPKLQVAEVNSEVEGILSKIGPFDPNKPPIAQRLISEIIENPVSNKNAASILSKVEKLSLVVDSFFLPGGEDVPPALYGKEQESETSWGNDYRRSILELAIIHKAFNRGIPLMAVCRGFQMSQVYFGAQLVQDVKGHKGMQDLQLNRTEQKGLYDAAMADTFVGASFHHQAVPVDLAGNDFLETVVEYEGIVKASELKEGGSAPMILLQFHPEFYNAPTADSMIREFIDTGIQAKISENNEIFFKILADSAMAHRNKKALNASIRNRL